MSEFRHYHGTPLTPDSVALTVFGRAFVSFVYPQQLRLVQQHAVSYALDNGAFSAWTKGTPVDPVAFERWAIEAHRVRPVDFAIVPDVIDGTTEQNDDLLGGWTDQVPGAPVWHLHEPIDRFARLCDEAAVGDWERVCLGSSGEYATPGSRLWWHRIGNAMDAVCDRDGNPPCKLHGLRMLAPAILSRFGGLASADSTNVARNHNRNSRRETPADFARFIERHIPASTWTRRPRQSVIGGAR